MCHRLSGDEIMGGIILGIDPGSHTGWCLMKNGKVYESGVQDFSKRKGESNGATYLRFRSWLNSLLSSYPIKIVVYEYTFSRSQAASEILTNLRGRIQEECSALSVEFAAVPATTLKKWATGKGNADKDQMMARAVAYLGRPPIDDNEADAVMVSAWGCEEYGG